MKQRVLQIIGIIFFVTYMILSCSDPLERDAGELAALHRQKMELVKKLLATSDSQAVAGFLERLSVVEQAYGHLRMQCEQKYDDSLQQLRFERAFRQAFINK